MSFEGPLIFKSPQKKNLFVFRQGALFDLMCLHGIMQKGYWNVNTSRMRPPSEKHELKLQTMNSSSLNIWAPSTWNVKPMRFSKPSPLTSDGCCCQGPRLRMCVQKVVRASALRFPNMTLSNTSFDWDTAKQWSTSWGNSIRTGTVFSFSLSTSKCRKTIPIIGPYHHIKNIIVFEVNSLVTFFVSGPETWSFIEIQYGSSSKPKRWWSHLWRSRS